MCELNVRSEVPGRIAEISVYTDATTRQMIDFTAPPKTLKITKGLRLTSRGAVGSSDTISVSADAQWIIFRNFWGSFFLEFSTASSETLIVSEDRKSTRLNSSHPS